MTEKTCSMCKQTKPLELFEKDKRTKDGRGARCKLCRNTHYTDPKPYKAFWRLNEKQKLYDIPVEITKEEVAMLFDGFEGTCIYCGVEESEETGTMSLEHIVPMKRGGRHHISNLVIGCKACNSKKNDKTLIEFYRTHEPFHIRRLDYIFKHVAYFTKRTEEEVAKEFFSEVDDGLE